jgi:hypothetical protein
VLKTIRSGQRSMVEAKAGQVTLEGTAALD